MRRLTQDERLILQEAGRIKRELKESRSSKTPDQVQVGDIFVSSWGYDQTNIDFYQVIGKTPSGKSVTLAPMTKKRVESPYDYEVRVVPGVVDRGVQPLRRKLGSSNYYGSVVRINSVASAYPWEGKPEGETAAGFGH